MEKQILKILLADDHRILRTGLKLLLSSQDDFKVVAEASNGLEVLDILNEKSDIDIILLDLSMPKLNGLGCLKEIKARKYKAKILILTMYNEQQYIKEAMLLGANGYICKDTLDVELFQALRQVSQGQRYLSEENTQLLLNNLIDTPKDRDSAELSSREKEVLKLIARGYSLSEIAQKLYLSVKTVSTYKTRIMNKLEVTQNAELVDYALRHNMLDEKLRNNL